MVRIDEGANKPKCWLSQAELGEVEREAGKVNLEREIADWLMGRCGLRASEVSYPADTHLRGSDEGEIWLLEIEGKNMKEGHRKALEAWVRKRSLVTSTNSAGNVIWKRAALGAGINSINPTMGERGSSEDGTEDRGFQVGKCILPLPPMELGHLSPRRKAGRYSDNDGY